jgi:hypothetical protein
MGIAEKERKEEIFKATMTKNFLKLKPHINSRILRTLRRADTKQRKIKLYLGKSYSKYRKSKIMKIS